MRRVLEVRTKIACYLSREVGISMAEMARRLGVGTSAIAMAIRKETPTARNCDSCELRPPP
jgi:predicted ArsR family transcriptional regulator